MGVSGDLLSAMHPSRRRHSEPLTAVDTERLLAGRGARSEAPAVQHALASLLANAAGPPTDQELAGEVAAVAVFLLATSRRNARHARSRNRFLVLSRRIQVVTAVVGTGIVVAFSGAAVANALPAPIQELAHRTFGAPAPRYVILAPKVPTSSPGHWRGDPQASPRPSAQDHRGKAKTKVIGKKSPTRPAYGRRRVMSIPPVTRGVKPSVADRGKA